MVGGLSAPPPPPLLTPAASVWKRQKARPESGSASAVRFGAWDGYAGGGELAEASMTSALAFGASTAWTTLRVTGLV